MAGKWNYGNKFCIPSDSFPAMILMYGFLYQLVALKSRDAYVGLLAEIGSLVFYGLTVYLLDMWNVYVFYFVSDEDDF